MGVEASWSELKARVDSAERDVNVYQSSVTATKAMGDSVIEAGSSALENGQTAAVVNNSTGAASAVKDHAEGRIEHSTGEGKRILIELAEGLPGSVTDLTKLAASSTVKAAAIRVKATEMRPIAEKNILMTKEDMKAFESNSVRIDAEINGLANLVDKITRESSALSSRVAAMNAGFRK